MEFDQHRGRVLGPAERFLENIRLSILIDARGAASKIVDRKFTGSDPIRIAEMHRLKCGRIDFATEAAFDERPIPCPLAIAASVDQPGVELLAIGIEPDLAARPEGFEGPAIAAGDPGLGCDKRNDGPTELEN